MKIRSYRDGRAGKTPYCEDARWRQERDRVRLLFHHYTGMFRVHLYNAVTRLVAHLWPNRATVVGETVSSDACN